jgi:hypothetical protein
MEPIRGGGFELDPLFFRTGSVRDGCSSASETGRVPDRAQDLHRTGLNLITAGSKIPAYVND